MATQTIRDYTQLTHILASVAGVLSVKGKRGN